MFICEYKMKNLNSSSSVNHRPMSETSDWSFVEHKLFHWKFFKNRWLSQIPNSSLKLTVVILLCYNFKKLWNDLLCFLLFVFFEAIILIWPVVKKSFFISSSFNSGIGVRHFRVKKLWIASLKQGKFSSLFWSVLIIICKTSFVWKRLARVVILWFL